MKNLLTAILVWAQDTDRMSLPVGEAFRIFKQNARGCMNTFTDPLDRDYFIPSLVGADPLAFFIDYILCHARCMVNSGIRDYGKLNDTIKNYVHVPCDSL